MNIDEKLKLQQTHGGLLLFRDGVFLRAYNESCYILTQLLNHDLKITHYHIKQYNCWVVMCAFPYNKLHERLPKAEPTAFGGLLCGEFDLSGYAHWFDVICRRSNEVGLATKTRGKDAQAAFTRVAKKPLNVVNVNLQLSPQQFAYLDNWQKGTYPVEVDLGFIESLKANLKEQV